MASIRKSDLTIHESLSVVTITGFEPEKEEVTDEETGVTWSRTVREIDPPGSANFLVGAYGMADDDEQLCGILWTDYDGPGWTFGVLIDSGEAEDLRAAAEESGYTIDKVDPVTEPMVFGDGSGTVAILKHPEGWVLAE